MTSRRPRRNRLAWWLVGLGSVVVLAWLAACAVQLVRGAREVQHGVEAVDVARGEVSGSDLLAEKPLGALRAAHADFSAANSYLTWPLLMPWRIVPVIGRQLDSVQSLSGAAAEVAGTGAQAVVQAHDILQLPHQAGPQRVDVLRQLSRLASSTLASIRGVNLGPSAALIGPLASKHAQFAGYLDRAQSGLDHAAAVTSTVADLLSGPTNYLFLAANNTEMRAGSGAFLQAGVLTGNGGTIQLGPLVPTGSIPVGFGVVPISGDLEKRWGFLLPNQEWRNIGVSPQFTVNAPLASRMWKAVTGQQVDGVIAMDFETVQQLLTVTGPVDVGGMTIDSSNVIQYLSQGQYAGLSNLAAPQLQLTRRDALGELARATLQAIEDRPIDLSALATALADSAQGRHIMAWSPVPSVQTTWRNAGIAGQLNTDTLFAAIINRGGNKLDPYVSMSDHLQFSRQGGDTEATLTVHLVNTAPPGPPSYVLGPFPGIGTVAGEYLGMMTFNVPGFASHASIEGYKTLAVAGPEGPTTVLAVPFSLFAGKSAVFTLHFQLPGSHGKMETMPAARIPAATWSTPSGSFSDTAPHAVSW